MGNDGGSIPKRRELVKEAARLPTVSELKATALESLSHAWTTDPVTSGPLDLESVVSDWRGRLYNYETVLKGLIPEGEADAPGDAPGSCEVTFASTNIKSLRDWVKLKLRRYSPAGSKAKTIWACPVSLKELGRATKAVYLVPCGHVFAEIAIRETQDRVCPECSEPFKEENVIPIVPTDTAELQKLRQRMDDLTANGLTHSLKKDKSNGKKKRKADEGAVGSSVAGKPSRKEVPNRVSGINNPMTASLTARVLAEQEERHKRRKLAAAR